MHEEVEAQKAEAAATDELQGLHDMFLAIEEVWEELKADHYKGVVRRDVNAARRRARVRSIDLAKKLKEYRQVSNDIGKTA